MTGQSMEAGMVQIAQSMKGDLQGKCEALRSDEKTAARAYQISISAIEQAIKLVTMQFSDKAFDEKYYSVRQERVFHNPRSMYFADHRNWFDSERDVAAKEAFLVYAHGVQMVRTVFLEAKIAELTVAEQAGAVEKIFVCKMIVGTLQALLGQWEQLWEAEKGAAHG